MPASLPARNVGAVVRRKDAHGWQYVDRVDCQSEGAVYNEIHMIAICFAVRLQPVLDPLPHEHT